MNYNKLKNLILYILSNDDYCDEGIKKLNKILYFIDFYFYRDYEKLITEANYAKAAMGPVIDKYKEVFEKLYNDGVLERTKNDGPIYHKPKIKPDISRFSSEEIDHIQKVIKRYGRLSSAELENISHQQQPWVLTKKYGDIIDPDLSLLIDDGDNEETEIVNENLKNEIIELANSTY